MTANTDDDNIEIIGGDDSLVVDDADGKSLTDLVEQPAKVMRIGTMIKQLLEEVRAAPLDDASRMRGPRNDDRHAEGDQLRRARAQKLQQQQGEEQDRSMLDRVPVGALQPGEGRVARHPRSYVLPPAAHRDGHSQTGDEQQERRGDESCLEGHPSFLPFAGRRRKSAKSGGAGGFR